MFGKPKPSKTEQLNWVIEVMNKVEYKFWTFGPPWIDNGRVYIDADFKATNSRNRHTVVDMVAHIELDVNMIGKEATFLKSLFEAIMDCEQHESQEWFVYNGRAIYDPHGEPERDHIIYMDKEGNVIQ